MAHETYVVHPLCVSLVVAANLLGISKQLCYRLVHEGQIPSVRLGRRILIPLAALNEMLDENRRGVVLCPDGNEKQAMGMERSTVVKTGVGQPPSG